MKLSGIINFGFAVVTIAIAGIFLSNVVSAQSTTPKQKETRWELHQSISTAFSAKFPEKHKYKITPLRINDNKIFYSGEVTASIEKDNNPSRKVSVLIKFDQTFSNGLSLKDIDRILKESTRQYVYMAKSLGGKLTNNEEVEHKGFPGKRFTIEYKERGKRKAIKIQVLLTDRSKIEQVLSGSKENIFTFIADSFFDSIVPKDGFSSLPGKVGDDWITHTSPNKVFTVKFPQRSKAFAPDRPKVTATRSIETFSSSLNDPLLKQRLYFNIKSYRLSKEANPSIVKTLIFKDNISRLVSNASKDNLDTSSKMINGIKYTTTRLIISPSEKLPHIRNVIIEAVYKDNFVIIKEFLSSSTHAKSGLDKTLFDLVKFHPEDYTPIDLPDDNNDPK